MPRPANDAPLRIVYQDELAIFVPECCTLIQSQFGPFLESALFLAVCKLLVRDIHLTCGRALDEVLLNVGCRVFLYTGDKSEHLGALSFRRAGSEGGVLQSAKGFIFSGP